MSNIDELFPVFRKTANCRNFYCVTSASHCVEIMVMGSKWIKHEIVADILPTRLFITDVITCAEGAYLRITKGEFQEAEMQYRLSSEKNCE